MDSIRSLDSLLALVEEKKISIYDSTKKNIVAQNVYSLHGMNLTDDEGVILLTMPKAIENGGISETRTAEGFSLLRLINDS